MKKTKLILFGTLVILSVISTVNVHARISVPPIEISSFEIQNPSAAADASVGTPYGHAEDNDRGELHAYAKANKDTAESLSETHTFRPQSGLVLRQRVEQSFSDDFPEGYYSTGGLATQEFFFRANSSKQIVTVDISGDYVLRVDTIDEDGSDYGGVAWFYFIILDEKGRILFDYYDEVSVFCNDSAELRDRIMDQIEINTDKTYRLCLSTGGGLRSTLSIPVHGTGELFAFVRPRLQVN